MSALAAFVTSVSSREHALYGDTPQVGCATKDFTSKPDFTLQMFTCPPSDPEANRSPDGENAIVLHFFVVLLQRVGTGTSFYIPKLYSSVE